MVPVSLRGAPLEAEVTIPDGRTVRVQIGVPDDSYISKRELDTVTVELYANGEHLAAVNTVLDADQTDEARALLQRDRHRARVGRAAAYCRRDRAARR